MKAPTCIVLFLLLVHCAWGLELKQGTSIEAARQAFKKGEYEMAHRAFISRATDPGLEMWTVDQGALLITYSKDSKNISSMTFWFTDERPKSTRKEFSFSVESFDTKTGKMLLQLEKPKDRKKRKAKATPQTEPKQPDKPRKSSEPAQPES